MPRDKPPINREVRADLACRECGYNLRGLRFDQTCPECGIDVEWSTHGHLLRYAGVRWLRSLYRGTGFLIASIILSFVALVALLSESVNASREAISLPLLYGVIATGITGSLFLTTQEPRMHSSEPLHSARRITRLLCAATAVSCGVLLIDQLHSLSHGTIFELNILHGIAATTWFLMRAMTIRTMSIIARRSSYYGMASRVNSLLVLLIIVAALNLTALYVGYRGNFEGCCVVCGCFLLELFYYGAFLFVTSEMRSELRTAIRISGSRPWRATPKDEKQEPRLNESRT